MEGETRVDYSRFVCAIAEKTSGITRLRSYSLSEELNIAPTVCEAALATSAATSFFKSVLIGACTFVDGAMKVNNPAAQVEEEAQNICCSDNVELKSLVKCFLSIGTGHPGIKPIKTNMPTFFTETLVKIATETEDTADSVVARWRPQYEQKKYFRFNVQQGLQEIGLEEYREKGTIGAVTYEYLRKTEQKSRVKYCVQNLVEKKSVYTESFA